MTLLRLWFRRAALSATLPFAAVPVAAQSGGAPSTAMASAAVPDVHAELLDLNRRLFETQLLEQDAGLLLAMSDSTYTVIAPRGVIELRATAIAGLRAFSSVDSIRITRERVIVMGASAVVLNRLQIFGEVQGPAGTVGPSSAMTVFHRSETGSWRVLSRALSECDPRAVARGIC